VNHQFSYDFLIWF